MAGPVFPTGGRLSGAAGCSVSLGRQPERVARLNATPLTVAPASRTAPIVVAGGAIIRCSPFTDWRDQTIAGLKAAYVYPHPECAKLSTHRTMYPFSASAKLPEMTPVSAQGQ